MIINTYKSTLAILLCSSWASLHAADVTYSAYGNSQTYSNTPFIAKSVEERIKVLTSRTASLELPSGNLIAFFELVDSVEEPLGFMVQESIKRGQRSTFEEVQELRDANPLSLYHALAPRGQPVPDGLRRSYGPLRSAAAQGWARDLLPAPTSTVYIDCQWDTSFDEFLYSAKYFSFPYHFYSENDGPLLKPDHWTNMNGFFGSGYSELTGFARDTTSFYAKIRTCFDDQETVDVSIGTASPEFWLSYKPDQSNGYWTYALFSPYTGATYYDDVEFKWHPSSNAYSSYGQGAPTVDWRLNVRYAYNNDNFWFAVTWANPTQTYTPNE